ncbi:hypothetical protein PUMCH_002528 [Australozyma saopauloensis]|uniref:Uncharacterized protein n=1 Tax=Australozyma saopauloensis TaxID=291208 RepID=A0AAX4HA38_9ASCO|nr:hypothetical protein PUMCH_002528 [[Candida] saopauloensis]
MQVAPPPNGKKLWRVKRASCSGPSGKENNSSLECLNNSLRISAAGKSFLQKRPPSKRPRSKPGMPKDFVFVDLSPVKSSDDELASLSSNSDFSSMSAALSANTSVISSPTYVGRSDSVSLNNSYGEELDLPFYYGNNIPQENDLFGLGLLNLNCDFDAPQNFQTQKILEPFYNEQVAEPQNNYFEQKTQLQTQTNVYPTPNLTHKRARSVSESRRKSAGGIQFKTYRGPKTSLKVHKRSLSEPFIKLDQLQNAQPQNFSQEPSLPSPLSTPVADDLDLSAFIKELEQDDLVFSKADVTQNWNDQLDMFSLTNEAIPECPQDIAFNCEFDAASFSAF